MLRAIALIIAVHLAVPALAEKRVALVLSVDAYRSIRPLANAVNDARAIEERLEALGFEVFSEANRDLRRMRRALDNFREDAAGADVALVFFAGHGVEIAGTNRLLPADADASTLDRLEQTSLPLEEVREAVAAAAKIGLIVLDACRNDPFGTVASEGRSAVSLKTDVATAARPGLGRIGRAENMLFAFSAAPGETASDGDGTNSPFTAALSRLLATDGLEIRSVLTLVQQEVYDLTAGRQLPYVESGLPTLFFASATGELPERERLLLAMADVTPALRDEVERVAAENDMPLAPLYGALISARLDESVPSERATMLAEAASAFVQVRNEMRNLSSADPEVARLRRDAEAQLSLGAFDVSRARLAEAASLDGASRKSLKANFVTRTLSEAASHFLSGGASLADLRYATAIADYETAAATFAEVDHEPFDTADRIRQMQVFEELIRVSMLVGDPVRSRRWTDELLRVAKREAEREPGRPDWLRAQSLAHGYLGKLEKDQGNLVAALASYQDGLAVTRQQLRDDPRNADFLHDAATFAVDIGDLMMAMGDADNALQAFLGAHAIFDRLTKHDPGDALWQGTLANSYMRIGNVLRIRGDLTSALAAIERSLQIRSRLVEADPGNGDLRASLAVNHEAIGDLKASAGSLADAFRAYRASVELREDLAGAAQENNLWQEDLSGALVKLGDALLAGGDSDAALAAYHRSLDIAQQLTAIDPANVAWQTRLSVSHDRIGRALSATGDHAGALAATRASIVVMEALVSTAPEDLRRQADLADMRATLGDLLLDAGSVDEALVEYEAAFAIRRRLAEADPSNSSWRRRLHVSHRAIADVYMLRNNPVSAFAEYAEGHVIAEDLAASDPSNHQWQRDLSVSFNRKGDALVRNGDVARAVEAFKASLAIVEKLTESDPDNAEWQWDLVATYWRIAEVSQAKAEYLTTALEILQRLQAEGRLAQSRVEWIEKTRQALSSGK